MIKMQPLEEDLALRTPKPEEKVAIAKYMRAYYASGERYGHILNGICLALGTIFLIKGLIGRDPLREAIFSAAFGILCFMGAVLGKKSQDRQKEKLRVFEDGVFQVADGSAVDITVNTEYPGVDNVKFLALRGEVLPGVYRVRQEELETGTPLLMLYLSKEKSPTGKEFTRVFTPYMLTDEGIKKAT